MKLFFDTETTGMADFKNPTTPDRQPYIVQFGALLTDDDGNEMASLDVLIRPNGWTIPQEVVAIHGISTEKAAKYGIPLVSALSVFGQMLACADTLIAHNISYDQIVTRAEYIRLTQQYPTAVDGLNRLSNTKGFCTMDATTNLCRLPGRYGSYKWPKLTEAHHFLFGTHVEGAHDAMTDVRACKRIYFELKKRGLIPCASSTVSSAS